MAEQSTCMSPACGITVEGNLTQCPQCGWAMRGPRNIKVRGWVLVGLGLFLVLFMGAIAGALLPAMLQPGKEMDGGVTFTGTAKDAEFAWTIFALVILFGLVGIAAGIHMVVRGRPNRAFTSVILLIAAILFAIAWAVRKGVIA
jgi:hypothetical protein